MLSYVQPTACTLRELLRNRTKYSPPRAYLRIRRRWSGAKLPGECSSASRASFCVGETASRASCQSKHGWGDRSTTHAESRLAFPAARSRPWRSFWASGGGTLRYSHLPSLGWWSVLDRRVCRPVGRQLADGECSCWGSPRWMWGAAAAAAPLRLRSASMESISPLPPKPPQPLSHRARVCVCV